MKTSEKMKFLKKIQIVIGCHGSLKIKENNCPTLVKNQDPPKWLLHFHGTAYMDSQNSHVKCYHCRLS